MDVTEYGMVWNTETVNTAPGGNGANKTIATSDAQILSIVDIEKFRASYPHADDVLLGIANGTSLRVMAQDVNRRNPKLSAEKRRELILNRLAGVRNAGVRTVVTVEKIVTKTVRALPNGTTYDGDNETEFRAAYMAAMVDLGVDPSVARDTATRITF